MKASVRFSRSARQFGKESNSLPIFDLSYSSVPCARREAGAVSRSRRQEALPNGDEVKFVLGLCMALLRSGPPQLD